jgi:hypothetical protein
MILFLDYLQTNIAPSGSLPKTILPVAEIHGNVSRYWYSLWIITRKMDNLLQKATEFVDSKH